MHTALFVKEEKTLVYLSAGHVHRLFADAHLSLASRHYPNTRLWSSSFIRSATLIGILHAATILGAGVGRLRFATSASDRGLIVMKDPKIGSTLKGVLRVLEGIVARSQQAGPKV